MNKDIGSIIIEHKGEKITFNEYLKEILIAFFMEGETFNGKRPFGESDWRYDICEAFIKNGVIEGKLDKEYGIIDISCYNKMDIVILEYLRFNYEKGE